jgi:hypothetical protein
MMGLEQAAGIEPIPKAISEKIESENGQEDCEPGAVESHIWLLK